MSQFTRGEMRRKAGGKLERARGRVGGMSKMSQDTEYTAVWRIVNAVALPCLKSTIPCRVPKLAAYRMVAVKQALRVELLLECK